MVDDNKVMKLLDLLKSQQIEYNQWQYISNFSGFERIFRGHPGGDIRFVITKEDIYLYYASGGPCIYNSEAEIPVGSIVRSKIKFLYKKIHNESLHCDSVFDFIEKELMGKKDVVA